MAVRDTLDKIENLVASASHMPLTAKIIVDENDLVHYVEDLRSDLPEELGKAEKIMGERDEIIGAAKKEAENIMEAARQEASRLVEETEIMRSARAQAEEILRQTQQEERDIMDRTAENAKRLREDADRYANQVFDQLIAHVSNTSSGMQQAYQGVQQTEQGFRQAMQVLQQAKEQMNRSAAQAAAAPINMTARHPSQIPPQG